VLGPLLAQFELLPRIMISTLILTPLMVFWFIPLSTHLLSGWLHSNTQVPVAPAESASTR
jgi:antibiotic biosynthesis monooxygenase (ABM) superfamily enzyme